MGWPSVCLCAKQGGPMPKLMGKSGKKRDVLSGNAGDVPTSHK